MARVTVIMVALLFISQFEDIAGGCANGFIQLDMLRTIAQKIPDGSISSNRLGGNELRLIPDWNFTCNGTITGFMLGADIRIVNANRTRYPELQIWRRTNASSPVREYTKVWSEEIRLNAGSFSPSGVLEYHLNNSFDFQTGDIFGVYHPGSSVVRIYYNSSDDTAPVAYQCTTQCDAQGSQYNIDDSDFSRLTNQFLLITPIITDSSCANGFLTYESLRNKAYDVNIFNDHLRFNQRVFPDVNFTCNGNLTKWIVAGTVGDMTGAEVQIWRRNNGSENDYTKVGYSILNATDSDNDNVYEHIPDPPLEFQEGDILGVYQQQGGGRMRVYYHVSTGPANYRRNININPPVPSTLIDPTLVPDQYDYPLVTVEIISAISTPIVKQTYGVTMSSMIHVLSSTTFEPSQLPATPEVSAAAVGSTIAALVVLAATGVIILIVVLCLRRRNILKSQHNMQLDDHDSSNDYPLHLEQYTRHVSSGQLNPNSDSSALESSDHIQLKPNISYAALSSSFNSQETADSTEYVYEEVGLDCIAHSLDPELPMVKNEAYGAFTPIS